MAGGGGAGSSSGGREGDWDCGGCGNRNYAFRSLCNRCKQPRLLVDPHTPRDSKWLPRAGDWICTGCSNNNYASRNNCKKCGLPKEEAAMPAFQMAGMAMPAYANYIARLQSIAASGYKMNFGMAGNSPLQQQLLANANWSYGLAGRYGMQSSGWPFGSSNTNQFAGVPKDWRNGDWLCSCGFHNYSSRTQCKECNAPVPSGMPSTTMKNTTSDASSTLRTKRLASEELANDWDNKRLNPGNASYPLSTAGSDNLFLGIEQGAGSSNGQAAYSKFDNGSSMALASGQVMPGLMGKGAKWREGDWMCSNCNNHNYASRAFCNRCKNQKESSVHPGVL
ncbi:RNA-binding protein involved in heterochromatin assembly dri1-like [Phragmites australis]|uniref:RNA-binding protein involved in heterochromatin assembly dri1-like n=1 Tax=Phragmites australis TaxID=29695 RepID=UPI002D77C054|nr:RNA-binding protein involved in heterochromatin assembly dri1-like [Phragmites australis]